MPPFLLVEWLAAAAARGGRLLVGLWSVSLVGLSGRSQVAWHVAWCAL